MSNYCGTPEGQRKGKISNRKNNLECLFRSTYIAAIQSGMLVSKAVEKAASAVEYAGVYEATMAKAVEKRLAIEFSEVESDDSK